MQLTMTGEYAIRTMVHLSRLAPGTVVQIADISVSWDIPETFLRKIVARLARAGLVRSSRGVGGGVALARPAERITLLEVVEQIEGPLSLNRCLIEPQSCTRTTHCAVHSVWSEAQELLRTQLGSKTFAELSQSPDEHAPVQELTH
jgi:Rrf2 family protein